MQAYFELTTPEYRDQDKAVQNVVALAAQGYRAAADKVVELTGIEVEDTGAPAPVAPTAMLRARASDPELRVPSSELPVSPAPVLSQLQQIFADLEALAAKPATTDAQLAAAVETAAAQFPELLPDLTAAIARPLAIDMAKAAVEGATEGAAK